MAPGNGVLSAISSIVLTAFRTQYLIFAIVQKGLVAGTIFGYVAWRWGVESSIYSHYTMNLILLAIG